MTVRIIHTADTHLRSSPKFPLQTPTDLFDAFSDLFDRTKRYTLDGEDAAFLHTGDLFDDADPDADLVDRVIDRLNGLDEGTPNPPQAFFIAGNHDVDDDGTTPALDRVVAETTAEYLTRSPTVLGDDDIALYGVQSYENWSLADGDLSFDAPPANVPVALCLHGTLQEYRGSLVNSPGIYSLSELRTVLPFEPTVLLCGHLHTSLWGGDSDPPFFYAGAPECVRANLCGEFLTANRITIPPDDRSAQTGEIAKVAACPRPWIDTTFTVDTPTTPQDVFNEVCTEWSTILHEKYPAFKEQYDLDYPKTAVKNPTIDIWLSTVDSFGVSDAFAQEVFTTLENWPFTHDIRLRYDTDGQTGSTKTMLTTDSL